MTARPPLPLVIDSTILTTADGCLKKLDWEFVHNLAPGRGKSVDLHAGGAFAKAMEVFYNEYYLHNHSFDLALQWAQAAYEVQWGDYELPDGSKSSKTRDRVWDAVVDYFREYPPDSDQIRPYLADGRPTTEFTFAIPLDPAEGWPLHPSGDPFLFGGRFDMLGQMGSLVVVRDEKTMSSTPSAAWAPAFLMRGQFLGYIWACKKMGIPANTVVVRGVVILKTMLKQIPVTKTYPDLLINRWEQRSKQLLHRIVRAWEEDYFPYSMGDACNSYGGCGFVDLCASPDPELWFPSFRKRSWNPLQKNPEGELEAADPNAPAPSVEGDTAP